jgi:hypothetical protein
MKHESWSRKNNDYSNLREDLKGFAWVVRREVERLVLKWVDLERSKARKHVLMDLWCRSDSDKEALLEFGVVSLETESEEAIGNYSNYKCSMNKRCL